MSDTLVIKPFSTSAPRSLAATSRYMSDLQNEGAKVPSDEIGPLSGSFNCMSADRAGQLQEMDELLALYNNPNSTQSAMHGVMSYPAEFRPSREQIENHLKIQLHKLGMDDHLMVWDAHSNTSNFHVHFLLCRVAPTTDEKGRYRLADNGIVKTTRKDERGRVRTRTDEAACRQAAISEINKLYGWGTGNLTHDADGRPQPRTKTKDRQSDKTRAGERRSGEKSRERQLAEMIREVVDLSAAEAAVSKTSFWKIADREFSSRALEMTIKMENGKPVGGFVTGPDNRKCSFSRAGKEYSTPALIKRFGPPSIADSAHHTEYDFEPFEYHENDITAEEAKKRLLPVFRDAVDAGVWDRLIAGVQQQGMTLARLGGGLVVQYNDGRDSVKCSAISNKYSLSRMEKILGPCPVPKTGPAQPSARDLLAQDATAIISRCVVRQQGLFHVRPELQEAGIQIVRKVFTRPDGERIRYHALVRADISIPFSALGRDADGDAYSMRRLERLDDINPTARHAAWLAWVAGQSEDYRRRHKAAKTVTQPVVTQPQGESEHALPEPRLRPPSVNSPWGLYCEAKNYYENQGIPIPRIYSVLAMHLRLHSFSRKDIMDCLLRDGFDIKPARSMVRWAHSTNGDRELSKQRALGAITLEKQGILQKEEKKKIPHLYKDAYGNLIMGDGKPGKDKGIDAALRAIDSRNTAPDPVPAPRPGPAPRC